MLIKSITVPYTFSNILFVLFKLPPSRVNVSRYPPKTTPPLHTRSCLDTGPTLAIWLCHAAQATALYIINRFLDRVQNQGNPLGNRVWDRVSDDVKQFLKDSLSASSLRNIGGRLEGFRTSFDHCQTSTTGTAKTRCLHRVFLSMMEAEGTFKGRSLREKSLLLKYFDRFTILFNAVTQKFKTSYASYPPQNGTINIDRTFRQRQCSFYRYQCEALVYAREFACRDLYVTLLTRHQHLTETWDTGCHLNTVMISIQTKKGVHC